MSHNNDQKRKKSPYIEMSRDNDGKDAHVSNQLELRNHSSTFFHKLKALPLAPTIVPRSPMAHNSTALDNLTCTDYVDFG